MRNRKVLFQKLLKALTELKASTMSSLLRKSYQRLLLPILSIAIVMGVFRSDGISAEPQAQYYRIDFTELKSIFNPHKSEIARDN